MKIIQFLGSLLSILYLFSCTGKQEIKEFPEEALDAVIYDLEHAKKNVAQVLESYQGKPTIVKIWAGWCGDCIKSMPHFLEFQQAHPEFNYVLFSVDHQEKIWQKAIEKYKISGNHYRLENAKKWENNSFTKAIGLNWIPRYMILDKNGHILSTKHIVDLKKSKLEVLDLIQ